MNYLTHQLLNSEELEILKKSRKRRIILGRWQENCWEARLRSKK